MLKNRALYILLLLLMSGIYIFTNTWYTITMLGLCVLLPVLSAILMLLSGKGLELRLDVPETMDKDHAKITCYLINSSVFPVARVTFEIRIENQMTGSVKVKKISGTAGGKATAQANLDLVNSSSGTVFFKLTGIRIYDTFGLFAFRRQDIPGQSAVIWPRMREVTVRMQRPVETMGDGTRYAPEKPGQDVSEVFAIREYAAGDEIRKIHWKLSSKLDTLLVRDFSLPLNYSVTLLLELKKTKEALIDTAVEVYLSLSSALLESGLHHNLAWFDAGEGEFHVRELNQFEDLEASAAQVLSSYVSEQGSPALDYYRESGYRNPKTILLYVACEPDAEKTAELAGTQTIQVIDIYETEEERIQEETRQAAGTGDLEIMV